MVCQLPVTWRTKSRSGGMGNDRQASRAPGVMLVRPSGKSACAIADTSCASGSTTMGNRKARGVFQTPLQLNWTYRPMKSASSLSCTGWFGMMRFLVPGASFPGGRPPLTPSTLGLPSPVRVARGPATNESGRFLPARYSVTGGEAFLNAPSQLC